MNMSSTSTPTPPPSRRSSPLQQALGPDWAKLPPALQAHHPDHPVVEHGHLDVEFPRGLQPALWALAALGALVSRRGRAVPTRVERWMEGNRQCWRRSLHFEDGHVARFDSTWECTGPGRLLEWVNPWLGLEMQVAVNGTTLEYHGLWFVLRLGRRQCHLPQWLGPGRTRIIERACGADGIEMDFRLVHPLFGTLFRYAGRFPTGHPTNRPDPD